MAPCATLMTIATVADAILGKFLSDVEPNLAGAKLALRIAIVNQENVSFSNATIGVQTVTRATQTTIVAQIAAAFGIVSLGCGKVGCVRLTMIAILDIAPGGL